MVAVVALWWVVSVVLLVLVGGFGYAVNSVGDFSSFVF